jgi:4-hydroxybenzoate polyprenyltransferase
MTNKISNKWRGIVQLMRADKPIGTYLLLWPTFWALWIAAQGLPSWHLIFVFAAGVFIMRSAGCVINDFADRKLDGLVKRTSQRPLVTGIISSKEALWLFFSLLFIALLLVLTLSNYTILLSLVAVFLATLYPFTKRFTQLPQFILGAAFSWGMIMAFAEITGEVPAVAWLLFIANLCWTVAYDTIYAMVDRDDDLAVGIKSTAILFGKNDTKIIRFLQLMTLGLLFTVGELQGFSWPYYTALVICAGLFSYHQILIFDRQRDKCFHAFLNNHYVGLVMFIGISIEYIPVTIQSA